MVTKVKEFWDVWEREREADRERESDFGNERQCKRWD